MRDVIFRCDQTAGCFLIEPVNDSRPLFAADARQCRAVVQQRVDQSMFALTCPGVNGEAGGFVDNDDVTVFEEYLERNRLRLDIDFHGRWLPQINFVAASDNLPRSGGLLIEPNESAADQLLNA